MISMNFIFIVTLYCLSLFMMILNLDKFMNILISLEVLVLNLFLLFCVLSCFESFHLFLFYLLVVVVCEGSMGLSLMISMIRFGGDSSVKTSSFLMC